MRVEDVVEALAQRRAGRDHLQSLDEAGLLTALQLVQIVAGSLRHQGDSTRASLDRPYRMAGVPEPGRPFRPRRALRRQRLPAGRGAASARCPDGRGRAARTSRPPRRGARGGRRCAARRSGRARRSRPADGLRVPRAMPRWAEATASATARSAPGSSTRTPPTTLTKTSAVPVADVGVAAQDGEHEREAVAVDAGDDAPRRHDLARGDQRLDLDEQRPGALHRREHDRARLAGGLPHEPRATGPGPRPGRPASSRRRRSPTVEPKRFFSARSVR